MTLTPAPAPRTGSVQSVSPPPRGARPPPARSPAPRGGAERQLVPRRLRALEELDVPLRELEPILLPLRRRMGLDVEMNAVVNPSLRDRLDPVDDHFVVKLRGKGVQPLGHVAGMHCVDFDLRFVR